MTFCVFHAASPAIKMGVHKQLREDTARAADQRGISHHMVSCSAVKVGREVCQGCCCFGNWLVISQLVVSSLVSLHHLFFLGFVLFASFSFISYTVFISTQKLSNFCPSNSLCHPCGISEQVAMQRSELTQNRCTVQSVQHYIFKRQEISTEVSKACFYMYSRRKPTL